MDNITGTLYYMVGLPGGGKDYFYETRLKRLGAVHVSSDLLRQELFGDVNDQTHNNEVFAEMAKRTKELLKQGKTVCYNSTGLSSKKRKAFLDSLHFPCNKVCVVIATPYEICLENNMKRDRHVPEHVIMRMLKSFEVPHEWEGWDEIIGVGYGINENYMSDLVKKLAETPHDNHHHTETIGNHMLNALAYCIANYQEEIEKRETVFLPRAVLLHDIGKSVTKVFTNGRGEPTEEAHYYGHENAGAYIYLSNSWCKEQDFYVASLIQHHMDHFKGQNYCNKVKERYGNNFMNDIAILHDCDLNAH